MPPSTYAPTTSSGYKGPSGMAALVVPTAASQTAPASPSKIVPAPAVITAKPALDNYHAQLAGFNDIKTGVANQNLNRSVQNATTSYTVQPGDKFNPYTGQPLPPGTSTGTVIQKPNATGTDQPQTNSNDKPLTVKDLTSILSGTDQTQSADLSNNNSNIASNTSERDSLYAQHKNDLDSLRNGTFPLTPAQQAIIDQTKASLARQETAQTLANSNYVGGVTNAGIAAGRNRYAPELEAGNIANAVNVGIQKIADLESKAAMTMATLQDSFDTKNFNQIDLEYKSLDGYLKDKNDTLMKMHQDIIAAEKDQRDYNYKVAQDAKKQQFDEVTKPIQNIVSELSKYGAPKSVIDAASKSNDVAGALNAAAGYLQDPTSIGGMYSAYIRGTQASGKIPMTAGDFVSAQKYSDALAGEKAKATYSYTNAYNQAAGKAAGETKAAAGDKNQQKLEHEYTQTLLKELSNRSGGLGLQDQKVNQAIHLKTLFNQYKDSSGNYNIPKAQYAEIAMGLANLISGSGTVSDASRDAIMQKTAKGQLNDAISYITGTPQNGSTQDVFTNLVDSIDRQGAVAEQLRDQDIKFLHGLAPSDLQQSRIDKLEKNSLSSYTNPTQNVEQAQNDAIGKITSFHDVNSQNAALIDDIHKQFPNMSAIDTAKKLGLIQ